MRPTCAASMERPPCRRRVRLLAAAGCVIALLAGAGARADFLVASRPATLKAEPRADAPILLQVASQDTLALIEDQQTAGYYHARAGVGAPSGWIYRTFVRRHPGDAAVTSAAGAARGAGADLAAGEDPYRHLVLGEPRVLYRVARDGYAVGFDARLRIPLWVQYELRPEDLDGPARRLSHFSVDPALPGDVQGRHDDYTNSGYARGHLAPAEDMSRSARIMAESFLITNVCPQIQDGFNSGVWSGLEGRIRGWVAQRGALTVITGPVFQPSGRTVSYGLIGEHDLAVPSAFFKIVVDPRPQGGPEALAFLMPNEDCRGEGLEEFLTTIDAIEAQTGLDLLSALPDAQEAALEAERAGAIWPNE